MSFGGITLYPIYRKTPCKEDYLLLEQAADAGLVIVTDTGSISTLKVKNRASKSLLILAGAQLVGGLQNRIANTTALVLPGRSISLPASCVERGRWSPRTEDSWLQRSRSRLQGPTPSRRKPVREELSFAASLPAPPSVRGQALADTHRALRSLGRPETDQVAIWDRVSRVLSSRRVRSRTDALDDVYARETAALESFVASLPYPNNAIGAIVASGRSFRWVELLSKPEAAREIWPRWVKSWALEYGGRAEGFTVSIDGAIEILNTISSAPSEAFKGQGPGLELRFEVGNITGSAYAYNGEVLHTVAGISG